MKSKTILLILTLSILLNSSISHARRTKKSINQIPRLTTERTVTLYEEFSQELQTAFADFEQAIDSSIVILREEGLDVFQEKAWPDIQNKISNIQVVFQKFKALSPYIGFGDQNSQKIVSAILQDMAKRFNADKIVLNNTQSLAYSYGLTEEEYLGYVKVLDDIVFTRYYTKMGSEDDMRDYLELIHGTGMESFVSNGNFREIKMEPGLHFIIGRSPELVNSIGVFSEEEIEQIRIYFEQNAKTITDTILGMVTPQEMVLLHRIRTIRHDFLVNGVSIPLARWEMKISNYLAEGNIDELNNSLVRIKEAISVYQFLNETYFELFKSPEGTEKVEIKPFLAQLFNQYKQMAELNGLDFKICLMEQDATIEIDKELLTRTVSNIIQNAIKYTPSGSITVEYLLKEGDFLKIIITDTGIGIPEKEISSALAGHRASNVGNIEGTGFGLAEVRTVLNTIIVDSHVGDLIVESEEGKGTTVIISIPY